MDLEGSHIFGMRLVLANNDFLVWHYYNLAIVAKKDDLLKHLSFFKFIKLNALAYL